MRSGEAVPLVGLSFVRCKKTGFDQSAMSNFAVRLTAEIIGETDSMWSRTRAKVRAGAAGAIALQRASFRMPYRADRWRADGGSEFKSVFEEECQRRGLELLICYPKGQTSMDASSASNRPRGTNLRRLRSAAQIEKLEACIDAFADHFNTQRPHDALAGLTPAQYLKLRSFGDRAKSHMYRTRTQLRQRFGNAGLTLGPPFAPQTADNGNQFPARPAFGVRNYRG